MMGPVPADAEALAKLARGITLRQPWGWGIAYAGKRIENRAACWSHRGPMLIHAGKGLDVDAFTDPRIAGALDEFRRIDDRDGPGSERAAFALAETHRASAVIAVANLVDAHRATVGCTLGTCRPWGQEPAPARDRRRVAHLVLDDVEALTVPVPYLAGRLYPWQVPDDLAEAVAAQLAAQR